VWKRSWYGTTVVNAGADLPELAQREGEREHPLAHGDLGEHAVHEVRCRVGHAAAAANNADLVIAKAQTLAAAIADYWATRLHDLTDLPH